MRPEIVITPQFVEYIPDDLADNTIYVSMPYAVAIHKCPCGCGNRVVTPFSPTDWKLIFDGKTITLHPSLGNWSFACQSHYWIRNNKVRWAGQWTQEEIAAGRARDSLAKNKYYGTADAATAVGIQEDTASVKPSKRGRGVWTKVKKLWRRA